MNDKYYLYNIEKNNINEYEKEQIMDSIYYLQAKIPNNEQLEMYKNNNDDELSKIIIENGTDNTINLIKESISKLEDKIPLYDTYSENIYIINKQNVYFRVIYNYYRFPDEIIINKIKKKRENNINKLKNNENGKILRERKIKKFDLALDFMNSFNLDTLFNTYIRMFYLYSDEIGQNITVCQRPSFLAHFIHIKPYYSKNEIINLALNMNIIKSNSCKPTIMYNNEEIKSLCNKVSENDISSKILLNHQEYMIKNNKVGLIQYYSLHGSYFINQYLRDLVNYEYKNQYLENIIKSMWTLVGNCPEFDKEYTLYRFVNSDSYLRHLDIGDIYTESGFMSTTRDPFYRPEIYNFGFILLKINIPKNEKGIGLCVETLSHFPLEQEIILPPQTILKLVKKDNNCEYFHINNKFTSQIKIRYEFDYVGKGEILFKTKPVYEDDNIINFLSINLSQYNTLEEKINIFLKNYLNPMYQCKVKIGDNIFTLMTEFFDSTGAYKEFYAIETKKGFSIYSVYNDFMLFFIEIGTYENINIMHVDYNRKYSLVNRKDIISDEDFILFISQIAYSFGIIKVIIYSEYVSCDNFIINNIKDKNDEEYNYYGGRYSLDIYNYLTKNIKRYESSKILTLEMNPKYSYYMLDKLKNISPIRVLKKEDNDELYQIYDKTYKNFVKKTLDNLNNFIVWIIKNKCYLIETLISKLQRLYKNNNPFEQDYYILDPNTYLYNRGFIQTYPNYIINIELKLKRNINIIPMNEYKYRNE